MKLLIVSFLMIFNLVLANDVFNVEINSSDSLIKEGVATELNISISGNKIDTNALRNYVSKGKIFETIYVAKILSEEPSENSIKYRVLGVVYSKDPKADETHSFNNKSYKMNLKYFSVGELKDKSKDLVIMNQNISWPWGKILILTLMIISIVLFINYKGKLNKILNAKKYKEDKTRLEEKLKSISIEVDLDKIEREREKIQKNKAYVEVKNLYSQKLKASDSRRNIEEIYKARKILLALSLIDKKYLIEFEQTINKYQYLNVWTDEIFIEVQKMFEKIKRY